MESTVSTLTVETRTETDRTTNIGCASLAPKVSQDYWAYRVRLTDTQSVVGFPKFSTIGIGFAVEEEDWNTNLPYWCDTVEIFNHIAHNKGDSTISDSDCIEAIRLIQRQAVKDRGRDGGPTGANAHIGDTYKKAIAEFHPIMDGGATP